MIRCPTGIVQVVISPTLKRQAESSINCFCQVAPSGGEAADSVHVCTPGDQAAMTKKRGNSPYRDQAPTRVPRLSECSNISHLSIHCLSVYLNY